MPHFFFIILLLFTLTGQAESITVSSSINVVGAFIAEEKQSLNFGDVIADPYLNGSVIIDPSGARHSRIVQLGGHENTYSAAQFLVTGERDRSYTISYPNRITLQGPVRNTITVALTNGGQLLLRQFNGRGVDQFSIGGEAHIEAAQPTGFYYGEYVVDFSY